MNYFDFEFIGLVRSRKAAVPRVTAEIERKTAKQEPSAAVSMDALVARVRAIAELSPVEFSEKMGDPQGCVIGRLEVDSDMSPRSLLKSWDKIGRASSAPLSESAYARFVDGEHPTADEEELYGANLRPNPTW